MLIQLITFLYAIQMLAEEHNCLKLIDLPSDSDDPDSASEPPEKMLGSTDENAPYPPDNIPGSAANRRFLQAVRKNLDSLVVKYDKNPDTPSPSESQDMFLKKKIDGLITQTMHDTMTKMQSISTIKERTRTAPPYKVGFILSLVRKSKIMLNDLFNLAVKHRDNWRALQQLKIFEYIVHTNVDTTNLVRNLVEIHMQYMNATNSQSDKKRVVLL